MIWVGGMEGSVGDFCICYPSVGFVDGNHTFCLDFEVWRWLSVSMVVLVIVCVPFLVEF